MKRNILLLLLIFILSILAIGCSNQAASTQEAAPAVLPALGSAVKPTATAQVKDYYAEDISRILNRGKLVIGLYKEDRPPFFMTGPDGTLDGLDIEIARGMAQTLGVNVEYDRKSASYQEMYERLANGEFDIILSKFSITLDRAMGVRFSKPYVTLKRAVMVNKLQAAKLKIEDYPMDYIRNAPVKIGVIANTSHEDFVHQKYKACTICEYDNIALLTDAVKSGEVFAAFYDDLTFAQEMVKNSDLSLYVTVYVLKDLQDYICAAVPGGSAQLLAWVNIYLDANGYTYNLQDLMGHYPQTFSKEK